jgi:hypothetical protein
MFTRSRVLFHVDQILGDDPRLALIALRQLLDEDVPWLERSAIRTARREGYEWARIGRLLGRTRQAIRQRYASVDGTHEPLRFEPIDEGARLMAVIRQGRADRLRKQELADWEATTDVVPW